MNRLIDLETIPGAARKLPTVGIRQIRAAIDQGELPVYDVGGWPRVDLDEVRSWIRSRRRAAIAASNDSGAA